MTTPTQAPPWQGNPWRPCDASEVAFSGPPDEAAKPDRVQGFDQLDAATQLRTILVGIRPRIPTPSEYEALVNTRFPGLGKVCWWVTDDFAPYFYNCHAYSVLRESGEVRQARPGDNVGFDAYFAGHGFRPLQDPSTGPLPEAAVIALFTEDHSARRSFFRQGSDTLWESKLGAASRGESLRVLHPLRAMEGGEYGSVKTWYARA